MARILVVDDMEEVTRTLSALLEAAGHSVVRAADGSGVAALAKARSLDLVIMDIMMPHKNGVEALREVRALCPGVRVLAMSGGGTVNDEDGLEAARRLGASVVLRKPFTRRQLADAVQTCLANPAPAARPEEKEEDRW